MLNHYKKIGLGLYLIAGYSFAEAPVLKMHIFKESPQTVKQPTQGGDLKMIIFDQNSNATQTLNNPLAVQAQMSSPTPQPKTPEKFRYWSAGIKTGYQYERTVWQVSNPTVAESWHDINIWKIRADLGFQLPVGLLLKGYAEYGFSFDGKIDRVGEFNNATQNTLSSGNTMTFSGALGYEFVMGKKRKRLWATLTPLVGYAYDEQLYQSRNNEYNTAWQGPWVGLEFALGFAKHHEFFSAADVHWTDFKALGEQQNYRLEHNATALGYKINTGYRFKPDQRWAFSIMLDYQHWQTGSGTEILNLPTQGFLESELKSVKRDAFGVSAAVDVAF